MDVITDPAIVFEKIKTDRPRLIGIDGINGVGKTSFAKEIKKLGYKIISLDSFLIKKSGGYFEFIQFDKLAEVLKKNSQKYLVIEGVLLLKILERLKISAELFIYLTDSVWLYDWDKEWDGKYTTMTLEEIIKDVEQLTDRVINATESRPRKYHMRGLIREVYEYSFDFRPWEKAHLIYKSK